MDSTAKLNDIYPQAWLADVLRRIADHRSPASTGFSPGLERPRRSACCCLMDIAPRYWADDYETAIPGR
jgi:hypothetical protein